MALSRDSISAWRSFVSWSNLVVGRRWVMSIAAWEEGAEGAWELSRVEPEREALLVVD